MKHVTVSAQGAGAQSICAQPHGFTGLGSVDLQPYFQPVERRALMAAVNTCARDLGLSPSGVMVVDALLSCLPDSTIRPTTLLTVFAANDTLCFRAKGLTDRQLRRHLARLEEAGLILRRDSANGKRFPIHRGGKIVGAFGIDLSPLLARAADLLDLAQQRRDEATELRGLKAVIQRLRADCAALPLSGDDLEFLDGLRNLLRRATLTLTEARAVITRLRDMLKPDQTPATDGQTVRHKEPINPDTKKSESWDDLPTLSTFYPQPPQSPHAIRQLVFEFGKMLGIGERILAKAIATLGAFQTLKAQDRIAAKIDQVTNPGGYLSRIIADMGKVGHGQLT
ncbi:helix-turn-helix domain-containing protein [Tropicibacter alexandrii]|uniref:helix-turn-helix domain-containing protein n=1 Tax=Tropicibacter alexandrii TaxID=2267683 RepID=UPI000EF462F8|nr:helix-turn-helix domain-containing protein [Tropicibacter alexandrii]